MFSVLIPLGPVFAQGLLFFLFSTGAPCVDRDITLGGVDAVRNFRYSSVLELVRFELKLNRPQSAMKKLQLHLQQQPSDAEAWELMGDLQLQQGERILAKDSYQKAIALGRRGSVARLDSVDKAIASDQQALLQDAQFRTILAPLRPKSVSSSKETTDFDKGGPLELSLLRSLDSLLLSYVNHKGSDAGFSLNSLRATGLLTRNVDFSALGDLSVVNGQVKSARFGTSSDQRRLQKTLLQAYSMDAAKDCTGALKSLMALASPSVPELHAALQMARRCGDPGAVDQIENRLADSGHAEPSVILKLAERAWAENNLTKARAYYNNLLQGPFAAEAARRIKIMDAGGSSALETLLRQQIKAIGHEGKP